MGLPDVIPQSVLFGNPDKAEPKLSPDGRTYAYLANSDKGVLNVFVQALDAGSSAAAAKQITNDTHRGERMPAPRPCHALREARPLCGLPPLP